MDFYVVLGVRRGASEGDIRRAYKRLVRQFHPDINPGDREAAAKYRDIARAFETLTDPDRRRRYDAGDVPATTAPTAVPGFAGFDFSPRIHAEPSTTFGDLFAGAILAATDRRPARGADVHLSLAITLEDVDAGGVHRVAVPRSATCRTCGGSGVVRTSTDDCVACEGTGRVRVKRGHMMFMQPCERCDGTGARVRVGCATCAGEGSEPRTDVIEVTVPRGVADGAVLHVEGMGHAGRHGGRAGDVVVTVTITPHPLYRREGDDLHVDVPVAIHEAALGARVPLPMLGGARARLRVPPGTQSGQRVRLRERGLPGRGGQRGDVIATLRLTLPGVLDERAKDLLREFGRLPHDPVRDARFPVDEDPQ